MRFDWSEQRNNEMYVRLVLLACGTTLNVSIHVLCKTRPPKLRGDKLASFKVIRVTGDFVVMASGDDRTVERVLRGDVDVIFICQDIVIVFPVEQTRPKNCRDVLQGQL